MAKVLITESILQDTADAIREKAGTVASIKPSEFAENISDISSGADLSDYFTDTAEEMVEGSGVWAIGMLKTIPNAEIVGTNISGMFASWFNLETIPLLDTSEVLYMQSMFVDCWNLISIPLIDTSNVEDMMGMFYGCHSLETIPLLNTSSVVNMNGMIVDCFSLTDTSLDNILQMCINAQNYMGTKTLWDLGIDQTTYPVSRIQALPHYADFVNAGWSIGYE